MVVMADMVFAAAAAGVRCLQKKRRKYYIDICARRNPARTQSPHIFKIIS